MASNHGRSKGSEDDPDTGRPPSRSDDRGDSPADENEELTNGNKPSSQEDSAGEDPDGAQGGPASVDWEDRATDLALAGDGIQPVRYASPLRPLSRERKMRVAYRLPQFDDPAAHLFDEDE